jgi:hypothetical protein
MDNLKAFSVVNLNVLLIKGIDCKSLADFFFMLHKDTYGSNTLSLSFQGPSRTLKAIFTQSSHGQSIA